MCMIEEWSIVLTLFIKVYIYTLIIHLIPFLPSEPNYLLLIDYLRRSAFSYDGFYLASGSDYGTVCIIDAYIYIW